MNAARTCCDLIDDICHADAFFKLQIFNCDKNGHTVLDALFLNILRSHTNVAPHQVDELLGHSGRFPGEEKDICGRWDIDSPCVRRLLISGTFRIPLEWKHVFCHTSVQGICHGMARIRRADDDWGHLRSGLFARRCGRCSQKLELGPLHALVLVAFHLAENGRPGETLFGILACLLTLLAGGINPLLKVEISVRALIQNQDCEDCDHTRMDAAELISQVPQQLVSLWPTEAQLGWRVFSQLLHHAKLAEQVHIQPRVRDEDEDESETFTSSETESEWPRPETAFRSRYDHPRCRSCRHDDCWSLKSRYFTAIWSAVLAEMLTYRRLDVIDPWLSSNFSMQAIIDWLDGETVSLNMPFFTKGMITPPACPSLAILRACEVGLDNCTNMAYEQGTSFVHLWTRSCI